ncbi:MULTISPECIES: hypothetical protein [unclassified Bradyrhizobium]|uniref:hypothetical protein n=1 Tax=unclassified Bradyrhizobium TaxID=2631580 RepID=UPI0028E1BB74|nr:MULTISPECIES: hypothetical protein [unclassified Bradyrhizobium]
MISEDKMRPPITEYDRELLATSDEELRKQTQVFCFDRARFESRISAGERWQQLLQAHLYFDHVITKTLEDALKNPDAINMRRNSFSQKLQLISAMGLLPAELISPVEFINGLRNRIAHDLDFEIDDKHIDDLVNCTPKHLREVALDEDERQPGPIRFFELLRVILFQIEVLREHNEYARLSAAKSALRLRTVLDKTEVVYRP